MKRVTSVLRRFHLIKEPPESDTRQRLKKELFACTSSVYHGFLAKPTAIAYDPVLELLAIGNKSGDLRLYGQPGVELAAHHRGNIGVSRIYFLCGQGCLVTLCVDSSLHLWQLNVYDGESFIEQVRCLSAETSKLKKITAFCAVEDGTNIFVGTDSGNIHQVDVSTFRLSNTVICRESITQHAPDELKSNPGHLIAIVQHPTKSNKLMIGFNRGVMVLWNLEASSVELTYVAATNLESLSFGFHGDEFISAHIDGSYTVWSLSDAARPKLDPVTPYGPFPCKAIKNIVWKGTKSGVFIIFSGGMPRASHGVRHTVSVLRGAHDHVVFDVTSKVVDFLVLCSDGERDSSSGAGEPDSLVILAEEELVAVDLLTPGWPLYRLPYVNSIHASSIVSASHINNVPRGLWERIKLAGSFQHANFSPRDWPIKGGHPLTKEVLSCDLFLTGHEDGTVRFWDVSSSCMPHLYMLSTSHIFGEETVSSFEVASNLDTDYEWPPFRRIGSYDPLGDDPQLGIQSVVLNSLDETLFVAGTTGHVVILHFCEVERRRDIEVLPVDLIPEPTQQLRRTRRPLRVKQGEVSFSAGFQPVCVVQLHPPAVPTAIAVGANWGMLSVGTAHGFAIVNYITIQLVHAASTLDPAAITEQIVTTLSRNRSLRKSLRDSFRRLRSRSSAVRSDHTKSVIGDLSGSTDDKIGQQVEPLMSTVGSRSLESEVDSEIQVDTRPITPMMLACSSSRASLPTMSPPVTPRYVNSRTLERHRPRTADSLISSIVRSLHFADTFISDVDRSLPTLWVGTSGGLVCVYEFTLGSTNDVEQSPPLKCVLVKQLQLRHCPAVLSISIVDRTLQPLPGCLDVQQDTGTNTADMTGGHHAVICTEDQLKIFALPSFKVLSKCRVVSRDGVRVRKANVVEFRSRSDENYVENCVACLTDSPDVHVVSLPHLRPQLKVDAVHLVGSRNASLLTRCGELFLLHSSSEYVRMSLSARRVLRPSCHIAVLPRPRSAIIAEPTYRDERVEPGVSSVDHTSPLEHALINGAEQSLDQSLEMASLTADDEQQSAIVMAGCHSTASDELTADCFAHSISSCAAGARDALTTDSTDVLAMPT